MELIIPENCGNAPRVDIVHKIGQALAGSLDASESVYLDHGTRWSHVGGETLVGIATIAAVVAQQPQVHTLEFSQTLTHGRFAATHGVLEIEGGGRLAFSHFFTFASTAKTARVRQIRTFAIPELGAQDE